MYYEYIYEEKNLFEMVTRLGESTGIVTLWMKRGTQGLLGNNLPVF